MTIWLVLHRYCLFVMDEPFTDGYNSPGGPHVSNYIDMCLNGKDELTSLMVNSVSIKEHDVFANM